MVGTEPPTLKLFPGACSANMAFVALTGLRLTRVNQRQNEQKQTSRNFKSDAGQNFPRGGSLKLLEVIGLSWTELVKAG